MDNLTEINNPPTSDYSDDEWFDVFVLIAIDEANQLDDKNWKQLIGKWLGYSQSSQSRLADLISDVSSLTTKQKLDILNNLESKTINSDVLESISEGKHSLNRT